MSTKTMILERIAQHVFRYGFSSLTMQGAAEHAQVSKRTLYKLFPNRESLLDAAFGFQIERVAGLLASIITDESYQSLDRLSTAIAFMADYIQYLPPVLMRDMLQNDRRYWDKVQSIRQEKIYPLVERLLLEARDEHLVRAGIEPRIITGILFSTIEAIANPTAISRLPFEPRVVFRNLFDILFLGILADEGRTRMALAKTIPYNQALEALF
jgi:AcrR family transcriptional regulator